MKRYRNIVAIALALLSMAFSFPVGNVWQGTGGSFSVTTSAPLPAVGDLLYGQENSFTGTVASCPAGFAQQVFCHTNGASFQICTKTAVSADTSASTYTFTDNGSGPQTVLIDVQSYSGTIDVSGACNAAGTGNVTANSVTTAVTDFLLWSAGVNATTGDNTAAPAGFAALANIAYAAGTNVNAGVNGKVLTTTGATGNIADSNNYHSVFEAAMVGAGLNATATATATATPTPVPGCSRTRPNSDGPSCTNTHAY